MSLFEDSNHFKIRLEFWNRSNSIVESKEGGGYDSRMLRSLPRYGGSIRNWVMQILSQYNIRNLDLTWESFDFLEAMEVYFQTISVDGSCLLHYHYTIEEGLCECVVYPTDEYLRNKMLFNYPGIDGESVAVSQKMIEQQLRDYANQYGTGSRTVLSTEFKREESLARREAYLADCKAEWLNDFLRYIDPFDDGVFAAITKKKFKYALESARPKGSAKITDRLDKMRGEQMWSVTPKTSFLIVDTEQIEAVIDYIEGKRLRSSGREEEAAKLKQPKILQAVKLKNDGAAIKIFAFSDVDAWVDGHPYIAPEENGPAKDFEIQNGVLIKYTGHDQDVVIPDGVRTIGRKSFFCCKLHSVTIPKGVTSICSYAFSSCTELTSIVIPDGVRSIGERAFDDCKNLTSVVLPKSVRSIGPAAFSGCPKLADEQGLVAVGGIVFGYYGTGNKVVIPDGVTSIGDFIFSGCKNLTCITIPDSMTSISNAAFRGCSGLADEQGLVIVGGIVFGYYGTEKEVVIPDGVRTIGSCAFYGQTWLESVTIPSSVTSIEEEAFILCPSLKQFRVLNPECKLGKAVFGNTLPSGLCSTADQFALLFTDNQLRKYVLKRNVWPKLPFSLQVELFATRQDAVLTPAYTKCVNNPVSLGKALLARLSENPSPKAYEAAANYTTIFAQVVPEDLLQQFEEVLKKSE